MLARPPATRTSRSGYARRHAMIIASCGQGSPCPGEWHALVLPRNAAACPPPVREADVLRLVTSGIPGAYLARLARCVGYGVSAGEGVSLRVRVAPGESAGNWVETWPPSSHE